MFYLLMGFFHLFACSVQVLNGLLKLGFITGTVLFYKAAKVSGVSEIQVAYFV